VLKRELLATRNKFTRHQVEGGHKNDYNYESIAHLANKTNLGRDKGRSSTRFIIKTNYRRAGKFGVPLHLLQPSTWRTQELRPISLEVAHRRFSPQQQPARGGA
jgi:hypothetical protein